MRGKFVLMMAAMACWALPDLAVSAADEVTTEDDLSRVRPSVRLPAVRLPAPQVPEAPVPPPALKPEAPVSPAVPEKASDGATGKEKGGNIFDNFNGALNMTADDMDVDFAKNTVVWTGHVEIWDSERRIKADRIVVKSDANQHPETIEAFGNVALIADEVQVAEQGRTILRCMATSDYAIVEVAKNTITLRNNPVLVRGSLEATNLTEVLYTYDPKGGRGSFKMNGTPIKARLLNPAELKTRWKQADDKSGRDDKSEKPAKVGLGE